MEGYRKIVAAHHEGERPTAMEEVTMYLEIFFSDLNPAAQQRVLDFYGYSDPKDGNFDLDIEPLCILESDLEDD